MWVMFVFKSNPYIKFTVCTIRILTEIMKIKIIGLLIEILVNFVYYCALH